MTTNKIFYTIRTIVFFIVTISYGQNNSVSVEFISNNIFEISESTLIKIDSLELLEFTGFDKYQSHEINFDDDQNQDLICKIAGTAEKSFIVTIMEWDNDQEKFIEKPNRAMNPFGEVHMRQKTVFDFNNDGLLDVYIPVENYHGRDGYKPDYYLSEYSIYYPAQVFFNNGEGFNKILLDTTSFERNFNGKSYRDYFGYSQQGFGDVDSDGIIDILRPDRNQHPDNNQHLFSTYSYFNEKFEREKLIHIGRQNEIIEGKYIDIGIQSNINIKDSILSFILNRSYRNSSGFMTADPEFWRYNISSGSPELLSKVILIRDEDVIGIGNNNDNQYQFLADLNLDGVDEIILGQNTVPADNRHFGIHIFNSVTGQEETRNWFDNDFLDSYRNGNNGDGLHIQIIDLNSDGLNDIFLHDPLEFGENQISFFMNTGQNFELIQIEVDNHVYWNLPVDVDNDGQYEIINFYSIPRGEWENPNVNPLSLNNSGKLYNINFDQFDTDGDGVNNQKDANPNDPYSFSNDIDGNRIFSLPKDNFSVSIENLSCRGSSNGSIAVSAVDENLNYTLTINGNETHNLDPSGGYSKSISNLNPGQYNLCFTVEGESGYNQCFDINISEPAPLSASSRVDIVDKSISFDLSGSDKYTIVHNGIEKDFDHSNPKIALRKGVNFLKVKTDKSCQGSYTEEVFISEEVEFYPNPTKDYVNLYIHGKDSTVDIRVINRDGNILNTSCNEIHSNRKVQINLEEFSEGIYLIQLSGETVDKTVKIVRE